MDESDIDLLRALAEGFGFRWSWPPAERPDDPASAGDGGGEPRRVETEVARLSAEMDRLRLRVAELEAWRDAATRELFELVRQLKSP